MIDCSKLLELQALDLAMDAIDNQIKQANAKSERLAADIVKEEELLRNKEALLKKITLRNRKSEADIADANSKIKDIELKMQRPGMQPDIYRALERELTALREKISLHETKSLQDMDKIETLKKDVEKSTKVFAGRKGQLEDSRKNNLVQTAHLREEKEVTRIKRQQATLNVEPDALEIYEDLRQKMKGKIIWDTEKSSCPSCGMSLTRSFILQIVGASGAEPCLNCGILLRWTGMLDGIHV